MVQCRVTEKEGDELPIDIGLARDYGALARGMKRRMGSMTIREYVAKENRHCFYRVAIATALLSAFVICGQPSCVTVQDSAPRFQETVYGLCSHGPLITFYGHEFYIPSSPGPMDRDDDFIRYRRAKWNKDYGIEARLRKEKESQQRAEKQ